MDSFVNDSYDISWLAEALEGLPLFSLGVCLSHQHQGNGKAEAAVKIAKRLIKKANESKHEIWMVLLHWKNTPNKIGSSPNQRSISRRTRTTIPSTTDQLIPKVIETVKEYIKNNKEKTKNYYDKSTKYTRPLEKGETVIVQLQPDNNTLYRRDIIHLKPDTSPIIHEQEEIIEADRVEEEIV